MSRNPLFNPSSSPTNTTKPTKAVNHSGTRVRLTHNTFDNSYFNFKTQRYGQYEPFFWKKCVPGDNEPLSVSHNVRSLPTASPILSPMTLNKDYFLVPNFAIQPNTWEYIFKSPTQGDDVPADAHNVFPIFSGTTSVFSSICDFLVNQINSRGDLILHSLLIAELFFSAGSLLYNLGYKMNPRFYYGDYDSYTFLSFDEVFDTVVSSLIDTVRVTFQFPDPDASSGFRTVSYTNDPQQAGVLVDKPCLLDLLRCHSGYITSINCALANNSSILTDLQYDNVPLFVSDGESNVNFINMDTVIAYQMACAQYYVNPRVDFLYNAQLYRDNWFSILREVRSEVNLSTNISTFDYNGIPVIYDYFSERHYSLLNAVYASAMATQPDLVGSSLLLKLYGAFSYLFGYQQTLKFGNYFTDSRTQALGYGEEGSDTVSVVDNAVSVTDLSQKLVLERFRGAVAHLDNTFEDYLSTMFHEVLPPDFHYPKFIAHSEFHVSGDEVNNTTSDDQGNIVTNLKSGNDTAEFNISISIPCVLLGISYFSIPRVYSQVKERFYFHVDRYDMFQPMLQWFGDQEIFNREKSDLLPNPNDSYGYVSRYGEYKQRVSQVSGAFVCSNLRSWLLIDDPLFSEETPDLQLSLTQSPLSIRELPSDYSRFLKAHAGYSLATDFHFILQYNNRNVDTRPMELNPIPLYPNSTL